MSSYQQQDRGDLDAYARYLANMDAAMRQKVALTAAHLPCQGRVADMGMGSGAGSEALAALYPRLQVEGVDVNPTMVEVARNQYQRPNLRFRVGDIAQACFAPDSLDGIVNSSVLHHVTSYNGYRSSEAARALQAQVEQLAPGGTLVVRDFLAPEPGPIELRLEPRWVDLWTKFSQQFRFLLPPEARGFAFESLGHDSRGWQRYRVERRWAVEFVLRKDYQQDWESEILEEYTYFTQAEFEGHFRRLGLRVLVSTPLLNPWIVQNRFEGQFEFLDSQGQLLDWPATNYLVVGEKVRAGEGVSFTSLPASQTAGYLTKTCSRHRHSGRVYDLVCRPHPTVDVLPYFVTEQGNLNVLVRHSYPRPIPGLLDHSLDGLRPCAYIVEPITAVQGDDPLGETVEKVLLERAGVSAEDILTVEQGDVHYPSPGGIREEVIATFARVTPPQGRGGTIRALDAHQLLRSAQVNGLSDHRLEMHIFSLMRRLSVDPGPWLGDQLQPSAADPNWKSVATAVEEGWGVPPARAFLPHSARDSPNFLAIERHSFQEQDRFGQVVAQLELESVTPTRLGLVTVAVLPMLWDQSWWVGLDLDDLPAVQAFSGNSRHWLAPAWRLPNPIQQMHQAKEWVARGLHQEYAVQAQEWAPLGGPYFPSPGLTPELVYPLAVRVLPEAGCTLRFFPLTTAMQNWHTLTNGHLRCLLLRAGLAHSNSPT
jgi:SAM-dependent methyltransferase